MVVAFSVVGLFILLILFSVFLSNRAYEKGVNVKKILLVQVLSFIFSLCSCSALAFAAPGKNTSENSGVAQVNEQSVFSATTAEGKDAAVKASTLGTESSSSELVQKASSSDGNNKGLGFLAMALCMGLACLGAGIAVAAAAPAAIGAITENEKLFGKVLIFVAMAEGVTVFGLLISIFIYNGIS